MILYNFDRAYIATVLTFLLISNRYRGDSQSYRYESKISVTYREHPQKDGLSVVGEVAYPNLDFEYTKVRRLGASGVRLARRDDYDKQRLTNLPRS